MVTLKYLLSILPTLIYAPVITDVSWRILILAMLVWNLDAKIIDVEPAFLLGDLDEEIYMSCQGG